MDENRIKIRLAGPGDAASVANLHFACSLAQPGAFMHRLGRRFFFKFYQIILNHPTSVVMCADAERDGIVGLVSATLDAKSDFEAIRKGRFQLFWAALPALIRKPSLLWAVYIRNKSLSPKVLGEGFCVGSGARVAYWGWLPDYPSKGKPIQLMEEFLRLMENKGISRIQLEVDRINRKVEIVHRLLGAQVVKKFTTADGRERIVMEHILNPRSGI